MRNTIYTQNRELSWLRFNERVLDEAREEGVPAFERLKFISIFTSNLDEFFMIRVGSLYDQTLLPKPKHDSKTGMSPSEQLEAIFRAVAPLYRKKDKLYSEVTRRLADSGVTCISLSEATDSERKYVDRYFQSYIQPILSPQIINGHHPFPHLVNKALYIVMTLKVEDKHSFGIIPVPQNLDRIVCMPGGSLRYMLVEDIICEYAGSMFEDIKIQDRTVISVTRNADLNTDDLLDFDEDFRHQMKKVLKRRLRLAPVRLECSGQISPKLEKFLRDRLDLCKAQVFCSSSPLEMSYVFPLLDRIPERVAGKMTYEHFDPQPPKWFRPGENIMERAEHEDLFLSYPYDQMNPFLQLLREAATDPRVISIKITIYRLASKAALVDYLRLAAENGKEVTAMMELRARFDEANNINWSESLEEAGCTVIYGIEDYKVHSKVCLITYMDKGSIKRITQIGTGNYNEKTAKLYTDMSLITSDQTIGADAAEFFRNISISNLNGSYSRLMVAPNHMKSVISAHIRTEIEKAKQGRDAQILVKINSLTDREIIDLLSEASRAGVRIQMIIRGICCLLPGIEGYTDNVAVTSVVGRFLEHSRVYCFGTGDDMKMYISSADLMTRNLNRRVEVACPVEDPGIKKQILDILDLMLRDNVKARNMRYDGIYEKKLRAEGETPVDCQQELIRQALVKRQEEPARPAYDENEDSPSLWQRLKSLFAG